MFLSFYEFLSRLRSVSLSFTLSLASIENQINKFLASTFKNNNPRSVVSFYYQSNISQVRLSSLIVYCFFMERQMPALQNREKERKKNVIEDNTIIKSNYINLVMVKIKFF